MRIHFPCLKRLGCKIVLLPSHGLCNMTRRRTCKRRLRAEPRETIVPWSKSWDELPPEIRNMILEVVADIQNNVRRNERHNEANLEGSIERIIERRDGQMSERPTRDRRFAQYASVCREWQYFFEPITFQRIVLGSDEVEDFGKTIAARAYRLGYIRHLWLRIKFTKYTCKSCLKAENGLAISR